MPACSRRGPKMDQEPLGMNIADRAGAEGTARVVGRTRRHAGTHQARAPSEAR
jgi:hypothetical protein